MARVKLCLKFVKKFEGLEYLFFLRDIENNEGCSIDFSAS